MDTTRLWEYRVRAMLADGWGVEDIAVLFEADINHIRDAARNLRTSGAFKTMFKPNLQCKVIHAHTS